jgi:hypothetical protein
MKSTACLELILARGFASIHLVNLSTATSRCAKHPGEVGNGVGVGSGAHVRRREGVRYGLAQPQRRR